MRTPRTTLAALGLMAAFGMAPVLAQTAAPSPQGQLGTPTNPGGGGSTMTQGTVGQTGAAPGTAMPPAATPMPGAPTASTTAPSTMAPSTTAPAGTSAMPSTGAPAQGAPVAGANSFTEGQARSRIADAGFTDVGPLQQDGNGVWRGRGMRGGTQTDVALDYQGNVTAGGQPVR